MPRALGPTYTSTRGLNHTPDGLPVCAARIAEGKKEDSYAALDKTSHEFLPPPSVRRVLRDGPAGGRVSPTFGEHRRNTEGRVFRGTQLLPNYAIRLHKWRIRLSLTINREIASAIFEGARNARGGERQFAAGRGLVAESNLLAFV